MSEQPSRPIEMRSTAHLGVIEVCVPLKIRSRGGRKQAIAPHGADYSTKREGADTTTVKALARAFRWRKLLEEGVYASISEIAAAERINCSYVSRILRLTLLAPDIVEALLDARETTQLPPHLLKPVPPEWGAQGSVMPSRLYLHVPR